MLVHFYYTLGGEWESLKLPMETVWFQLNVCVTGGGSWTLDMLEAGGFLMALRANFVGLPYPTVPCHTITEAEVSFFLLYSYNGFNFCELVTHHPSIHPSGSRCHCLIYLFIYFYACA